MYQIPASFSAQRILFALCAVSLWLGGADSLLAGVGTTQLSGQAAQQSGAEKVEEDSDEEKKPPARQNAVLRRYFRRQYMSFAGDGVHLNRIFMERYVDRQIDNFLEQTQLRVEELKRQITISCETWRDLSDSPDDSRLRQALRAALEELQDSADGLGDRLAVMFRGMDYKSTVPPAPASGDDAAVDDALALLKQEIEEVHTAVRDYFFEPSHTVRLETLDGDDILARLYRLKKVAEGLRKSL